MTCSRRDGGRRARRCRGSSRPRPVRRRHQPTTRLPCSPTCPTRPALPGARRPAALLYVRLGDPGHLEFVHESGSLPRSTPRTPPGRPPSVVHVGGGGTHHAALAGRDPPQGARRRSRSRPGRAFDLGGAGNWARAVSRRRRCAPGTPGRLAALPDDGSADVVVGDAFGARSVPWAPVHGGVPRPGAAGAAPFGGLYVLNRDRDRDPIDLVRAVTATVDALGSGPRCWRCRPPSSARGGGNVVVVAPTARSTRRRWPPRCARPRRTRRRPRLRPGAFARGAPVLTDDCAPVDQLITTAQRCA
ncbi:hypothetical protein HBB16_11025 [Pseudonocardia sp. MCCB 268]|nr:hypothetical protein [Pseudonocardia cytotoxica]